MPFTGAHPLAVLPFVALRHRLPLDPTCLVIGAMAPDVEYFVRGYMYGGKLGHTWLGVLVFCVPVTLVLAFAWQRLVAPALLAAHPARAWPPAHHAGWLPLSAALGASTHVLWDALTHPDGFIVVQWPALAPYAADLQLWCSIAGLAIIGVLVLRARPRLAPRTLLPIAICGGLGVALFVGRLYVLGNVRSGDLMVAPVSGILYGLIFASLVVRARGG